MAAQFPKEGRKHTLNILFGASREPKVKLWKLPTTPLNDDSTFADLTEANFSGYAPYDLSSMAAAIINDDGQGQRQATTITFTMGGGSTGNTIYGWVVTMKNDAGVEKIFMVEKFPAPQLVTTSGDYVQFDLTFLDQLAT